MKMVSFAYECGGCTIDISRASSSKYWNIAKCEHVAETGIERLLKLLNV